MQSLSLGKVDMLQCLVQSELVSHCPGQSQQQTAGPTPVPPELVGPLSDQSHCQDVGDHLLVPEMVRANVRVEIEWE
jgi:hypothetical protein